MKVFRVSVSCGGFSADVYVCAETPREAVDLVEKYGLKCELIAVEVAEVKSRAEAVFRRVKVCNLSPAT